MRDSAPACLPCRHRCRFTRSCCTTRAPSRWRGEQAARKHSAAVRARLLHVSASRSRGRSHSGPSWGPSCCTCLCPRLCLLLPPPRLSLDYLLLNIVGFACYTAFNGALKLSSHVQVKRGLHHRPACMRRSTRCTPMPPCAAQHLPALPACHPVSMRATWTRTGRVCSALWFLVQPASGVVSGRAARRNSARVHCRACVHVRARSCARTVSAVNEALLRCGVAVVLCRFVAVSLSCPCRACRQERPAVQPARAGALARRRRAGSRLHARARPASAWRHVGGRRADRKSVV